MRRSIPMSTSFLMLYPGKLLGATERDVLRALGSMLRESVPGLLPYVDGRLEEIDLESEKVMMSELKKLEQRHLSPMLSE